MTTAAKHPIGELMDREIEQMERFSREEEVLQRAVLSKDWPAMECSLRSMRELSDRVNEIEDERARVFEEMKREKGVPDTGSFYDLLVHIPSEERVSLSEKYRNLKVAVLRVKGFTGGIETYLTSASVTLQEVLSDLFPGYRQDTYGKNGSRQVKQERLFVDRSI